MIYFLANRAAGTIKIGYSADPPGRVPDLQVGCSDLLEMLATMEGDRADEDRLHQKFDHLSVRGEWFMASEGLLDFIGKFAVNCEPLPPSPEWNAYCCLVRRIDKHAVAAFFRGCGRHDATSNLFFWLRKCRGEHAAERLCQTVSDYAERTQPAHATGIVSSLQDRFQESF